MVIVTDEKTEGLLQKEINNLKLELMGKIKNKTSVDDINDINALKAEILYRENLIKRKIGIKEVESRKELANIKSGLSGLDEKNKKRYYAFKKKYSMISKLNDATNNILRVIESLENQDIKEDIRVKVKS